MRISYLLACAGIALSAATLGAQKPKKAEPKKTQEGCVDLPGGRVECRFERRGIEDSARTRIFRKFGEADSAAMRRAALGMQLSATGSLRDTIGVFVTRVTPKGPAENAGIVEGDRIVSINGVDLRIAAADIDDGYTSGLPSHRLTREVQKLTPGSRVNLRVYSGGRVRDVQVTAGRASDVFKGERGFGFGIFPGGPGMIYQGAPPGSMRIFRDAPGADMRIFRDAPGADMRIFRDGMPMDFEDMPKLDVRQLEELKALPGKMESLDKIKMLEPRLMELQSKIRGLEDLRMRSLEPLQKMRLINPWTIRIMETTPARTTTAIST
ncbi:MAG TPA: PDZ domain-containing protein [Gemmatimonadaceae bacterium]